MKIQIPVVPKSWLESSGTSLYGRTQKSWTPYGSRRCTWQAPVSREGMWTSITWEHIAASEV